MIYRKAIRAILRTAVVIALPLTACTPAPTTPKGLNCFPAEAARWIYAGEPPRPAPGEAPPNTGTATIYVDGSASMAGYIRGATETRRPMQDFVHSLPGPLAEIGRTTSYRAFGTTIGEVIDSADVFDNPDFYACRTAGDRGCESHLDAVFAKVAQTPDEMAVVLTDLWFDNSAIQTSGLTQLQPLFTRILKNRRTIEVYGIEAPFAGKIYDLPTGDPATRTQPYVGRHPLFMIVIGSKRQVLDLDRQMLRSGSKRIAADLASGVIRRAIFTLDPGPDRPRERAPMEPGRPGTIRPGAFASFGRAAIQQFRLTEVPSLRPKGPPPDYPTWTGPKEGAFLDHAIWEGPTDPGVRLWRRKDKDGCSPASWIALGAVDGGWTEVSDGQQRFTLDPLTFYSKIRQEGVYLLTGELTRRSVTSPNPATGWMTDWNLDPERVGAYVDRPDIALFPTLNLSEVARIMEGALATAAEQDGGGITGFSVLIKVGD